MEPGNKFGVIKRPELPANYNCLVETICFMQTDIDYYTGTSPGSNQEVPILRIYGVTEEGHSVMAHVHQFVPYFWVDCPEGMDNTHYCNKLKEALNNHPQTRLTVESISIETKESIMFYTENGPTSFFKVNTFLPKSVAQLRTVIERGFQLESHAFSGQTYESNIPFTLRYMIDSGIVGMC